MSYVSLMVHVDADRELGGRISIAADLADRFHARLIGVAGWAPMSVFLAEEALINPAPAVPDLQDMKSLLDLKGQQFCKAVSKHDREVEWRFGLDFPTEVLAREARAADLVITGNERENRDPFRSLDPAGFLLKAGRPVLVVPASVSSFSPKRIGIAWKDTREARRAVRDSLPFLQQAESVTIIQISETNEGNGQALHNVKDVARYLNRHRVKTIDERVRAAELSVTDSLLCIAREENIDLIVAGAYGHSRLGELGFRWGHPRAVAEKSGLLSILALRRATLTRFFAEQGQSPSASCDGLLVTIAVLGLTAGIVAHAAGYAAVVRLCWTLATPPVIVGSAVSIVRNFLAGRLGVDAIALLSMTAALALGDPLAGAVVALMYSGGNVLQPSSRNTGGFAITCDYATHEHLPSLS